MVIDEIESIVKSVPGASFKLNFGDAKIANFTVSGPRGSDTYAVSQYGLLHVSAGGLDPVVQKAVRKIKAAKPWTKA